MLWKAHTQNTSPTTHFDVAATATKSFNSSEEKISIDFLPHGAPMKHHHFTACRALQKDDFLLAGIDSSNTISVYLEESH